MKTLWSYVQVVAQVNDGKGDFKVTVRPKASLCDGMFHKISGKKHKATYKVKLLLKPIRTLISTAFCMKSLPVCLLVIKRKNVVQLHVDTVDNYKIGPPSSTAALTKTSLYVGGIPGE